MVALGNQLTKSLSFFVRIHIHNKVYTCTCACNKPYLGIVLPEGFLYPIVFLPCRDLEVVRSFYNGILGLELVLDQGSCLIFQVGACGFGGHWGFCSGGKSELIHPKNVCLTLVVASRGEVDEWYERLTKLNVTCTKPPSYTAQFHIYNAFFRDPMNYTIVIQVFDVDYAPSRDTRTMVTNAND